MEIYPSTPEPEEVPSPLIAKLVGGLALAIAAISVFRLLLTLASNNGVEQIGHITFGFSGLVSALLVWSWSRALTWIHSIARSARELTSMSPEALSDLKTIAKEARAQASLRDVSRTTRSDRAPSQRDLSPTPDSYRL